MVLSYWYIIFFLALAIFIWRKDLRRVMLWAGFLAIPILFIKPLITDNWGSLVTAQGGYVRFVIEYAVVSFSIGALASSLYEVVFRHHLSSGNHPMRPWLISLLAGPIVFFIVTFGFHVSFTYGLLISLALDLAIVLIIRKDLFWDAFISGIGMGLLYLIIYLLFLRGMPGDLGAFWFTENLSGITIFSLPVEEIMGVILFGALWGPLYIAIKDLGINSFESDFELHHIKRKIVLGRGILVIGALALIWAVNQFVFVPNVVYAHPTSGLQHEASLQNAIRIFFNRPVSRENLKITIDPPIDFTQEFTNGTGNRFYQAVSIIPQGYLTPDKDYTIKVESIKNVFGIGDNSYTYSFHTQRVPQPSAFSIQDGQTDVNPCQDLAMDLDQENDRIIDYLVTSRPALDLHVTLSDDKKKYSVKPKECFGQGVDYEMTIKRALVEYAADQQTITKRGPEELVRVLRFKTKKAPYVATFSPQGDSVLPTTQTIVIEFEQAMIPGQTEKSITIEPSLEGNWQWDTDKKLLFTSKNNLSLATRYTFTLPQGVKDAAGGFFAEERKLSFQTIGAVKLLTSLPRNKAGGVHPDTSLAITLDQPVDHPSAERAFAITPSVSGIFAWTGNTLIFDPATSLARNTTYTLTLKAGIKSLYGQNSTADIVVSFTTEESVVTLAIPLDYQDKALSCEAAALKMALRYKGLNVSEEDIMAIIGYDPTIRNGTTWGDPDQAFVGSINGKQNTTGYGVHWAPIAKAAKALGRNAQAFSGWSVADMARELAAGNPIVVWGVLGQAAYDPWYTPSGRFIPAWKGEHARTLIGFKGSVDNPTHFIINDPITGRITWTVSQFKADWSKFNNSGVVVY